MNSHWGHSLFFALLASSCIGAAEAGQSAPLTTQSTTTKIDGLLSGAADATDSTIASPSVVSLAAVKELSDASGQLRGWLEEIIGAVGAVSVASAAILTYRRKKRDRTQKLQNLYQITEMPAALSERQTPRYLPSNPYGDVSTPELLSRQIEHAAESSLEFGRVFGLIYFDLGERPSGDFSSEARDWDFDQSELLGKLKNALRRTDHVTALSEHEIVACIALLPGKTELASIAERLRKIGLNTPRFNEAFALEPGLALYPVCGYRGEELIEHARSDYRARKTAEITYAPPNALRFEAVAYPKA